MRGGRRFQLPPERTEGDAQAQTAALRVGPEKTGKNLTRMWHATIERQVGKQGGCFVCSETNNRPICLLDSQTSEQRNFTE